MKNIVFVSFLFICKITTAQYVFNFSEGKSAKWSNSANWVGGVVPPLSVNTITLQPPDNSEGWLCLLDVDGVICNSKLIVQQQAKLTVLPGKTIFCHDSIKVENNAVLNLEGNLRLLCPAQILNNGTFIVAASGSIEFDDPFTCPDDPTYFINNGPLYVNGQIHLDGSILKCYNLFWNKGLIQLFNQSHFDCTGEAINDGTISGGTIFSAKSLINNGTIELTGTDAHAVAFSCHNSLINRGSIGTDVSMYFKGTVINYQAIKSFTPVICKWDTVSFFNYGNFYLMESSIANLVGSLYNKGSFDYQEIYGPTSLKLSIVNDGEFKGGTTHFVDGSVINNNTMNLIAYTDSTRIKIPFINKGTLIVTGPIELNDAFINQGELIIQ